MKNKFKMNLQLFGEDALTKIVNRLKEINDLFENDKGTDELKTEKAALEKEKAELEEKNNEPKGKTFTQEELDIIIQTRLDRAMKKAEEDRKQAEELAKLSEKERAKKELEIKEKELEEEKKKFYKERLELQTTRELGKLGLPIEFTEYVLGENAEETQTRIASFHKLWEEELEKRRIGAMKGKTPGGGTSGDKNPFSKEHFNLTEQGRIFREDPEKAKLLQKQAK